MIGFSQCIKPVIAAVHGGCIGGGVDLITAADIRYCTQDAFFQIKEVDIGIKTLESLVQFESSTTFAFISIKVWLPMWVHCSACQK